MKELTQKTDGTLESFFILNFFKNHGYCIKIGYLKNIENQ
jgi:hypothetical protein